MAKFLGFSNEEIENNRKIKLKNINYGNRR
jgi:hypothetical protein